MEDKPRIMSWVFHIQGHVEMIPRFCLQASAIVREREREREREWSNSYTHVHVGMYILKIYWYTITYTL